MTTGAMVLGAVPLAYASGAGSESRMQIGLVIVGGMTFGTVLTLFVVPVVYSLLARRRTAIAEPHPLEGTHAAPAAGARAVAATVAASSRGPAH
jgi:multidrug efflux pump